MRERNWDGVGSDVIVLISVLMDSKCVGIGNMWGWFHSAVDALLVRLDRGNRLS